MRTGVRFVFASTLINWTATSGLESTDRTFSQCAAPNAVSSPLSTQVIVSANQSTIRSPQSDKAKSSFMVIWENRTRNPLCSVEKLHRSDFASHKGDQFGTEDDEKNRKHRPPFHPEQAVPVAFRVNPKDFNDCRLDRGHMAPAADFSKDDTQYTATFTMANISPQAPMLNRGPWERLEAWIRNYLLQFHFEEVLVISGPVFAPVFVQNQWLYLQRTIGSFPNLVTVPTHFYKVIVGRAPNSQDVVVAAFLFPNSNHVEKKDIVFNQLVKLEQLESIVGYKFFPNLLEDKDKTQLDLHVPSHRDLTVLLNVQQATLPAHGSDEVIALLNPNLSNNSSSKSGNNNNSSLARISGPSGLATSNQGIRFCHLCAFPGMDCRKIMFSGSK